MSSSTPKSYAVVKPEILSPAGYWPELQAAIEAGADAIYFGLTQFTARAKVGFTREELPEVMRTLHQRGVKGYLTFNTLVFDEELDTAARRLAEAAEAGVDALIVQDVGIAQLAQRIAPSLPVHASTQMSITSVEGIRLAQQFGVARVVLARELSLDEIRMIRAQTDCGLEIFVHGALCVAYSGQCFSSEAWGGRSANRGQCAQACRLPYELLVDDVVRPLGDARYLLSPGDLYALEEIPEIVQIGVQSLKIEGRYKDAEYVALTTRAYREAVDRAWAGHVEKVSAAEAVRLKQVYSRSDMGPYFLTGTDHQSVVIGRAPRHRGVLIGHVTRAMGERVFLTPTEAHTLAPLKAGDGIVFDAADWRSPQEPEEGGRVYEVAPLRSGDLALRFKNHTLDTTRIRVGDRVWRTHDPDIEKLARTYTAANTPVHKQGLNVRVIAQVGAPLVTEWWLVARPEVRVTVRTPEPLGVAQKRALDETVLRAQLGRLGDTAYVLERMQVVLSGAPFAPTSWLNDLRREAVERLVALQSAPPARVVNAPESALAALSATHTKRAAPSGRGTPQVHLLVRTPEQLDAALGLRPASITLDYLDLYGLRPAVERVQAAGLVARVASPRVLKPDEQRIVQFLLRLNCALVVRSTGLLEALQGRTEQPLIGDFSLNAANALTAETFLRLGLARLTPTHDLNAAQITALAAGVGAEWIEVVAYHHLPVFHTEHCVFCRFLSDGTSYKDCGEPCGKYRVALRDVQGRAHPVMADVGCRNTVFGAEAQEASRHLDAWRHGGIRHYRLEFVHETPEDVVRVTQAFSDALAGRMAMPALTRRLAQVAPQGTTEGSFFIPLTVA